MVNRLKQLSLLCAAALLAPILSFAQFQPVVPQPPIALPPVPNPVITDPGSLTSLYEGAAGQWAAAVYPYAMELFAALAFLEVAAFGWSLWRTYHGDLYSALLSTTNKLLVIGIFFSLLLNGQVWATDIIGMFETVGKSASGIPSLTPSGILAQGFNIFGTMLWGSVKSGLMGDIPSALALIPANFLICLSFVVIAFQFSVTLISSYLALGLGLFFLAFGGSRWTTPYVERYFAYCVATGVKLMALYALIGVGWSVSNTWITQAQQSTNFLSDVETAWKIMCGAILYAGFCWYGSAEISRLLGGSPNLSHSDFVSFMGPMISAGVAAGIAAAGLATGGVGAVAGGGAAAAGMAAKAGVSAASSAGAGATQISAASVGKAAGQMAQIGASAISRMPSGGSHTPPPQFVGFGH